MTNLYNLKIFLRSRGKIAFIASLNPNCKILDVGCGNNSPYLVKSLLPQCDYTGIDIGDYNQLSSGFADRYIITSPADFSKSISELAGQFDAVICSHNLEHCNDRIATLLAMLHSLKPGGRIYLSFPSEQSLLFPKRRGTLNYNDDATHKNLPPDFRVVKELIELHDFYFDFTTINYRPLILRIVGLIFEPISSLFGKVILGTWEYYGFETIIWAKRKQ
jgi:SAM-dependent methyltransferase